MWSYANVVQGSLIALPQSRLQTCGVFLIQMASRTLLLTSCDLTSNTSAASQSGQFPMSQTCTAIPFFLSMFSTAYICSVILLLIIFFVSLMYLVLQPWHGILYTTSFFFKLDCFIFSFTNCPSVPLD